jgi:hypothetical protein
MPLCQELASLSALMIREEHGTLTIKCAEQNSAERGLSVGID